MDFHKITIDELDKVNEILKKNTYSCCDYTLFILFMWQDFFDTEIKYINDGLIIRSRFEKSIVYSLPLSTSNKEINYKDFFVCQDELTYLKSQNLNLNITPLRDYFDYIYDINDLAYLKGKKNNKTRNHVNKFLSLYDYQVSEISENDFNEINNFFEEYIDKENKSESYIYDIEKNIYFFKNYHLFKKYFYSYKVVIKGKIVAIASGEVIKDTLYLHILKGSKNYEGVYYFLNKEFCLKIFNLFPSLKYVNREDDAGDLGLRKSKLQYHPLSFIEKYLVKVI